MACMKQVEYTVRQDQPEIPFAKLAKAEISTNMDGSADLAVYDEKGDKIASFLGKKPEIAQDVVDALWAMKQPPADAAPAKPADAK